ncbi:TVP38/TMEM64 family protein [Clostridiales bacterium COT073_COT-073]|nr:TVP38/TMEM64 family protein [Clostridiales bacterium COT073_COT-073]
MDRDKSYRNEENMWEWIKMMSQPEFWVQFMESFGPFRFLAGILIAMIEAFFPPLPLAVLVTVNIMGFGFFMGYVLSYIGTCIGTILVYFIMKKLGARHLIPWLHKQKEYNRFQEWLYGKGIFPLIILFSFPFTPSVLVSVLAALSEIRKREFTMAVLAGKAVMIFFLSVIGYNISDFTRKPLKSVLILSLMFGFLFLAKYLLARYDGIIKKKLLKIENKQKQLAIEIKDKIRYNKK